VDDEPEIRALLLGCFRAAGYTAYEAADATAALARLAQHPEIRLVLTDIVMPGTMSGLELAAAVGQRHPGLKIVFMSGYVPTVATEPGEVDPVPMLRKPFRIQHVLATVAALLAGNGDGNGNGNGNSSSNGG
jgi:CheY-like chemotaxis protein